MRLAHARLAAVGALVVAGMVLASLPAQAATSSSGSGAGRAVIHLDAKRATVEANGNSVYTLTLPPTARGQWMGERKNARGQVRTRVGDITGAEVAARWSRFKYTDASVPATLLWNRDSGLPSVASVQIQAPRQTDAGIVVEMTSQSEIPSSLEDVSLSISRAPGKKVRSLPTQTQNVTSDLWISNANSDATHATARIYNSTNNNTCYSKSAVSTTERPIFSVPSNTCDNIAYANEFTDSNTPNGVYMKFLLGKSGSTSFQLAITPPNQSTYTYDWTFTWSTT